MSVRYKFTDRRSPSLDVPPDDTMGAIAESIPAYAQPLLDETDGLIKQMNRAPTRSQFCRNLAIMALEERDEALRKMRSSLEMEDDEFEAFRRTVVVPMTQRHGKMFPGMHRQSSPGASTEISAPPSHAALLVSREVYPGTGPNAPCPCDSGKKYRKCRGR